MKYARILLVAAVAALPALSGAQERLPEARPSAEEVRALRLMVEKQGRQLDDLRQAVEELSKVVQLKDGVKVAVPPGTASAPAPSGGQPGELLGALPAPSTPAAPPSPPAEPRVERAEPAPPAAPAGPSHTVAKGETLTSIAKHYNVSIQDLHKANKITDDRKLQIGQVLQIPIKTAATLTEKKETP